jgi:phenylalanyl-tRNA synthetase beta chain
LITDASKRFSERILPHFASFALERLSCLIQEHCGGRILKGKLFYDKTQKEGFPIFLNAEKVSEILGRELPQKEILKILKNIYCKVSNFKKGVIKVLPPPYRLDLQIEEDLIEEIIRIIGYDKLKPVYPAGEFVFKPLNQDLFFSEKMRDTAMAAGFCEVSLYAFAGEKEIRFLDKEISHKLIEVQNPFRPEFRFLRPYLSPSLLNGLEESLKFSKEASLFELGSSFLFQKGAKDAPELTRQNLAFAVAFPEEAGKEPFSELKSRLNAVFEAMGLPDVFYSDKLSLEFEFTKDLKGLFHPFKLVQIEVRGKPVGILGELHPEVKREFGLKAKIALAEFSFDEFLSQIEAEKEYRPISKYPALMRDLAVLVPKNAKTIDVTDKIENTAGELLVDSDIFDIYEGEGIPADKKSLAFRLVFQSKYKTLADPEVNKIMDKIIAGLEANPDFEVRRSASL